MNKLVVWFTKITGYLVALFYFRRKTYYVNKKNQSRKIKKAAIIISNHTSVYDFGLTIFLFFTRDIYVLVAEIIFQKNKFLSWFIEKIGAIKVERAAYDFSFMAQAEKILAQGKVLEIFPEGRLPLPNEEKLLEFKPSYVLLALKTHAPIIPIYTNGSYGKKKRACVIIGEKIYLHELYDNQKSEKENLVILNQYVYDYLKSLGEKLNDLESK